MDDDFTVEPLTCSLCMDLTLCRRICRHLCPSSLLWRMDKLLLLLMDSKGQ